MDEQRANDAYEAYRARGVMRDGRRFGRPPKPYTPPSQPVGKINVTDPDSRNLKTPRGYVQGYSAQAVCKEQQIVVAAEVAVSSAYFDQMDGEVPRSFVEEFGSFLKLPCPLSGSRASVSGRGRAGVGAFDVPLAPARPLALLAAQVGRDAAAR